LRLAKSNRRWLFLALAIVTLAAVACGDSATDTPEATATIAPTETPLPATVTPIAAVAEDLTVEEEEYIEQVRAGWRKFNEKAEDVRAVLAQVYSIKSRLFEALKDAGAGTAYEVTLQLIGEIIPPARFQEDHRLMVDTLTVLVAYDRDVGAAVENQNLPAFAIANARLAENSLLMISNLDPRICVATEATDRRFQPCDFFSETVPGGIYGAQVYNTMVGFSTGVFSRFVGFGPEYEVEDILATLSVIQPELTEIYSDVVAELQELQPSNEFAPAHNFLVKYLEEALAINQSRSKAVEAEDTDPYRSLSEDTRVLFCDARQQLGAGELRDIVRVAFLDPIGACGGSDY
jgi:hypothetical protein